MFKLIQVLFMILKSNYLIPLCVCVCGEYVHLSTGVHGEWKPEALDPLAMELSVVMSHMMWVPVIEFSSSARPRGALSL